MYLPCTTLDHLKHLSSLRVYVEISKVVYPTISDMTFDTFDDVRLLLKIALKWNFYRNFVELCTPTICTYIQVVVFLSSEHFRAVALPTDRLIYDLWHIDDIWFVWNKPVKQQYKILKQQTFHWFCSSNLLLSWVFSLNCSFVRIINTRSTLNTATVMQRRAV